MVSNVCITSEYHITTYIDIHFNPKTDLVDHVLVHGELYTWCELYTNEVMISSSSLNLTFLLELLHRWFLNRIYTTYVFSVLFYVLKCYIQSECQRLCGHVKHI